MTERERLEIVDDYLGRLDVQLHDLPQGIRIDLIEDVRRHIEEAWGDSPDKSRVVLLNILDRLGEPEELAREGRERLGLEGEPPPTPTSARVLPSSFGPSTGGADGARRRRRLGAVRLTPLAILLLLCVVPTAFLLVFQRSAAPEETISISQIVADARAGRVERIEAREGSAEIIVSYEDGQRRRGVTETPISALLTQANLPPQQWPEVRVSAASSTDAWLWALSFLLPLIVLTVVVVLVVVLAVRSFFGRPSGTGGGGSGAAVLSAVLVVILGCVALSGLLLAV